VEFWVIHIICNQWKILYLAWNNKWEEIFFIFFMFYGASSWRKACMWKLWQIHPLLLCIECFIIQRVPLATEPGISLIILTPMKILQQNLNRSTFVVWEMKRNVSVVRLIVATRSSGPPASQPVSCLIFWSLCHLTEGAYTIRLLFVSVSVCVSSHGIVGKFIGILWRSECLLFALIGKQNW